MKKQTIIRKRGQEVNRYSQEYSYKLETENGTFLADAAAVERGFGWILKQGDRNGQNVDPDMVPEINDAVAFCGKKWEKMSETFENTERLEIRY